MPAVETFGAKFLAAFRADRRGGIAILFAVVLMAITLVVGMAVDYARLTHTRTRLAQAADAAALAAGRALLDGRLSDADVKKLADHYFRANLSEGGSFVETPTPIIKINRISGEVTVEAASDVPMTLTRIAGFSTVKVPVLAATLFDDRDIELALALDVTISMQGQGKIGALKTATKNLLDMLLPDQGTGNKVRVGLAPYSSGVNAGPYAEAATGEKRANCTFEREGNNPAGDQAPGRNNYLKTAGDPGVERNADCPNAEVVALSSDKRMLKRAVDRYSIHGSTAGHLGAMWASYLLSPSWSGVFGGQSAPVAYNDRKTVKAMVLMSDGLFNTIGGHNYGDTSRQARESQDLAVEICDRMRAKSIQVYAVGFMLEEISPRSARSAAEKTLRDCAGSSDRYFDAADGEQLGVAFSRIANHINNLRLTR